MAPVVMPALALNLDKYLKSDMPCAHSSTALLIVTGPQTEQGVGLCLPLERFLTRHLNCHYLMDQAYCDPMLSALWSGGPRPTSG